MSSNKSKHEDASRVPDPNPYPTTGPRATTAEGMSTATSPARRPGDVEPNEASDTTPPKEARTDAGRGTGELGSEGVDGSRPLRQ